LDPFSLSQPVKEAAPDVKSKALRREDGLKIYPWYFGSAATRSLSFVSSREKPKKATDTVNLTMKTKSGTTFEKVPAVPRLVDLSELLAQKSLFLFGPRQTGKTFLARLSLKMRVSTTFWIHRSIWP
jgi:hypothetical protein